ncbi:phosphotransferase enzyme family protein [Pseudarthrobacter sp. TAF60_1]|uniref:phosphotransferase enzyme family protein n=1 Tax=Pseudarthrobacter sp. TAF60_1 TaxID=3233071 RepID=UPI003F9A9E4B
MSFSTEASAAEAVRLALTAYGLADGDVQLVKYRENFVFRVQHTSGDFAVRLHRPHYNDNRAIRAELELLGLLEKAGFNVPGVIKTTGGDLLTTVDDNGVEHTVSVLTWVPDAAPMGDIESALDGTSPLTADSFRKAGELAGALHNFLAGLPSAAAHHRPDWDYEGLVGEHAVWGNPFALHEIESSRSVIADAVAELAKQLKTVGKTPENYSVIHADLTPENILVSGDQLVVIDLDDFGTGWHAFEIATLLFWFQRHPQYAAFKEAALSGYASKRSSIDEELLAGMLLARGLTYLGWAADRRGDETAEFIAKNLVEQVTDNARSYLAATATTR